MNIRIVEQARGGCGNEQVTEVGGDDVRVAAVVEHANVGDGLQEGGGIVDGQFGAVVIFKVAQTSLIVEIDFV